MAAQKVYYRKHQRMGIGLVEYKSGESMRFPHYHDTYEIYLMLDGERYVTVENESVRIKRGDLLLIEPYALHIAESRGKYCRRYLMNIYAPLMNNIISSTEIDALTRELKSSLFHLADEEFDRAYHIFKNIDLYFHRHDAVGKKLMYAASLEILDFIGSLSAPPLIGSGTGAESDPVSVALKYIHNNYAENITLDFISSMVNMSKSNFCLVFKKNIGETFISYLNHVRISHAHRLICETRLPIRVIAEQTGFMTSSYMIAMFKKINGITPNAMRELKNEN